jgi:parvulin-like peptidyl-prolyl isomerase
VSQGVLSKRNLAIFFGVAFVAMVVIVGVAIGVGHPNVPSDDVAVIDDSSINIPGLVDSGKISKANFDRFLLQTAKQNGLQAVPQASDPQYKQLKDQSMQAVLQIGWIVGEANKRDLTFTDTQVNQSLQQIKSQFKTEAEYVKARDQAGLTDADVLERAKLQLIQNKIQEDISNGVGTPSTGDARDYYDANKQLYTQPSQRTIRIIQNKDPQQIDLAYQALRTDQSPANWKKVAAQYSTDPTSKAKGGLRTDVVPGSFQQPLDGEIFSAQPGQLEGPVPTSTGNFVFQVISATPEKVTGFDETTTPQAGGAPGTVSDQIKQQLRSQQQQEALQAFSDDFRVYWTNLTQCASDYVIQGCDNFDGGGPTCDPDKLPPSQPGQTSQGCPAPVFASCQESTPAQGGQAGQLQCTGSGSGGPPSTVGSYKPLAPWTPGPPQGPHPPGEGTTGAPPISFPGLTGG